MFRQGKSLKMAPLVVILILASQSPSWSSQKTIEATWEELPAILEGRKINAALTNGVVVHGRVIKVTPAAMQLEVQSTSDKTLVKIGSQDIPSSLFSTIKVKRRSRLWRTLLMPLGAVGVSGVVVGLGGPMGGSLSGGESALVIASAAGGTILGYIVGLRLDDKTTLVMIVSHAGDKLLQK